MKVRIAISVFAVATSGCLATPVWVIPSGPGIVASPKPRDCRLEFFRTKVDQSYDELAAMHAWGGTSPERLQRALGEKACGLGADAVIVTQDYQGDGTMNAVAIKYRDPDR